MAGSVMSTKKRPSGGTKPILSGNAMKGGSSCAQSGSMKGSKSTGMSGVMK